jgi:hypothetical protein
VAGLNPAYWIGTVKAVLWSFLGLRARSDFDQDVRQLRPLQVIAVALLGVFLFVGCLAAFVHWMVPG